MLRTIILTWKDFARTELERQVCDFATNLAMDSSQGSAFLSTSGYQTSLKNSSSSFQYLAADEEVSEVSQHCFHVLLRPRKERTVPTARQSIFQG